ncbi:beta-galactosidase [Tamlana nanhaiensis]|uniref:Beta-galactosidase n=1 Tax=Neotamlana nanhaiensis TaxID=1382798 RepID=A0A0D7WAA9_9FLAO|nr:glycoside hydrolase family 2 TIM barrel-domain containing protein [Tamlana nanhaiensis]KJD34682.1 beta-galactosidase [Tamlana nanhaiensis]
MNKIILVLFTAFLINSSYETFSKEETYNRKQRFNFDWKFKLDDSEEFSQANFNDEDWRNLNLPHDWSIEGKPEKDNVSGVDGGFFPTGTAWYRKTFHVSKALKNKKVSIYFEGVYMNAKVFINGKRLGDQPYGYTSFSFDLSSYLNIDAENTIAVRVDNSQQKNSRWYTGSGIYRNVWLMVTEPLRIEQWGVTAVTKSVVDNVAEVAVKTIIKNETNEDKVVLVEADFLFNKTFKNGKRIYQSILKEEVVSIKAKSQVEVNQIITIQNPYLWSPVHPNLYDLNINLYENGGDNTKIDSLSLSHGIRTIEFSSEDGFVLNGKKTLINGGCVHHDNGALGAAAYDRAEVRKVALMKAAGFNALRTSHNPPSEAFLNACDSLGMLVVDEAFDGWREMKTTISPITHDYASIFDKWWKHDLQAMVKRDKNHPSIIMWSIGNEIIERTKPEAVETAKMLSDAVKEIDATRPVTSAMTSWGQGWDIFDPLMAAHDVAGYNYQLQHAENDHERVPSRIIVNTESYPKNAFFIWNLVNKNNYIIGDFVWTAMDYLGESGIGRYYYPGEPDGEHWQANLYPWHGAYCGDVDLIGWRKPISHYRSMLYNDTEMLYMAVKEPNPENGEIKTTSWAVWPTWESWTWPNHEGKLIDVEVYSKYPKVRLYLNDQLVGEKSTTVAQEFKATFKLPYKPGILKAVAVSKTGKEKESTILKTAEAASKIKLTADRKAIRANGQDLAYITVEITDENGVLNPTAANKLDFLISGPGEIIGVDNADLKDTNSYYSNTRNAWHGRALVIVKSGRKEGNIQLEVSSEGIVAETINILSKY